MSESDRSTVRREGTGVVAEYSFFFFFFLGLDIETGMDEDGRGIRKMSDGPPFYTQKKNFHPLSWRT